MVVVVVVTRKAKRGLAKRGCEGYSDVAGYDGVLWRVSRVGRISMAELLLCVELQRILVVLGVFSRHRARCNQQISQDDYSPNDRD